MKDVYLVITILSNLSLNDLLVHKNPFQSLLTKIETSSLAENEQERDLITVFFYCDGNSFSYLWTHFFSFVY
jgi:hypothetical protein